LGWRLIDMDSEIEEREGRSIPDIFRIDGEPAFRAIERKVLAESLGAERALISTGGGAVAFEEVWADDWLGAAGTLTLLLDAPAEELYARLVAQQAADPAGATRPMLEGDDPLGRITVLKASREPWYGRAQIVLPVQGPTRKRSRRRSRASPRRGAPRDRPRRSRWQFDDPRRSGRAGRVGGPAAALAPGAPGLIVADPVWPSTISRRPSPPRRHRDSRCERSPSGGRGSKSMAGLALFHDGLLNGGIERNDVVIALGAAWLATWLAFAAATVLRGVGLVQVPRRCCDGRQQRWRQDGINHAPART